MEVCASIGGDNRCAAYSQQIAVPRNYVADDGVPVDTRHAGARQNNVCSEFTFCDVKRALRDCRCSNTCGAQCTQALDASINSLVNFEFRLVVDMNFHAPEVAIAVIEGTNSDRIGHFIFADVG